VERTFDGQAGAYADARELGEAVRSGMDVAVSRGDEDKINAEVEAIAEAGTGSVSDTAAQGRVRPSTRGGNTSDRHPAISTRYR
jgi:hypothetical protein